MNNNWKVKNLEEVCENLDSKRIPITQKSRNEGKYPYYGASGIVDYVDEFLFDEDLLLVSEDGANLLARTYPIAFSVSGKVWVNNHAHVLKFDKISTQRFIEYYLNSIKLDHYVSGMAQPKLNQKSLNSIVVPFPPLSEQQRIVSILDEAFTAIAKAKENAEKSLQNAHELFESYLHSIFGQRGEGWIEKTFSELCNIKHGFAFRSEFFTDEGDYVVLTPGNFYESGGYRDRGEKQKYYSGHIPRDYVLEKGDLLVVMTEQAAGLLGSPIIVPESDKFLHNQRLGLVTKKPGAPWTNEFFFHVFNTHAVRKAIHDSASGVKVRHTSPTKIGDVVVSFPTSISEQHAIVSKLTALEEETQRLEGIYRQKLAALEELKKSILQKAFSGELTASSEPTINDKLTVPRFIQQEIVWA